MFLTKGVYDSDDIKRTTTNLKASWTLELNGVTDEPHPGRCMWMAVLYL